MNSNKKQKRWTKFQDNWLKNDEFKQWLIKKDEFSAKCGYCDINFSVKYEGLKAVTDHLKTNNHKTNEKSLKSSQTMTAFVTKTNSKEEEEIRIAEVCLTYHTVYHHLSYRAMDCNTKLVKELFKDSKIANRVQLGRTKMEAIAKNILSPISIKRHCESMRGKLFSISSDASNRGNVKLFPIGVQYFDVKEGIINFVLDFYEDPKETSDAIFDKLTESLKTNSLNLKEMIAYSGDNASVNYGKHHSVFTHFQQVSSKVIKANCNGHILHNTNKFAFNSLDFDIENLILKMYSHFAISAKRVESLKSCYEYTDNDFQQVLRHVPTRWLTLFPAIDRLIENIIPLKDYFIGLGSDDIPMIIKEFVWSERYNGVTNGELFLYFSSHFMKLFHTNIQILEKKSTNATNLYDMMSTLRSQLKNRLNLKFFGSKIDIIIKFFPENDKNKFISNAVLVYQKAISYLENHFDFDDSPFKLFAALNLDSNLKYQDLVKIADLFELDLSKDCLLDEIFTFNEIYE